MIIPFVIAAIYLFVFASNRYVSSSQVVVRQQESGQQAGMPGLALLMGAVDPVSREDTLYLKEYIVSHDMLQVLEKKLNWTDNYSGKWNDPLFYLSSSAPSEEKLKFYQRMVTTNYDETTGLLQVDVQAFSSEYAQAVLKEILVQSEIFVNNITRSMADEQLAFARRELLASTERYEEKQAELLAFQNEHNLFNAEVTAESMSQIVSNLEAEIVKEKARLNALKTRLADNAPQIRSQENKINALIKQLEAEQRKITSGDFKAAEDILNLNTIAFEYRRLQVDLLVAEEFYKTSLAIVENAKLETIKNIRSLIAVVQPNLPEKASYPRTIYNLITIFIVLLLLYGITQFLLASIRDHRE
ncbi:ABC transporter permease [Ignatzschineria rhizosphaerae]|uniref:ABC transporter permease n=1 Tax=Ignatzschineria rhizosphaerae TaxID=2923279 RepID=A0ABY3X5B8_9GAMM|nr:ABC transporter permease [Ignatzschineria rhizosphaerae]UNM97475.1 ABC transporter permease [Ignatzschineria rhizosphaerae]